MIEARYVQRIAEDVSATPEQVSVAIQLLEDGATLPFVARYRKDATGCLDEASLEKITAGNAYFTALQERRKAVLESIAKQGKLTNELRERLENCEEQAGLEDLYLPYKRKQRTKATLAREQGLVPLADFLWQQAPGSQSIEECAGTFVKPEKALNTVEEALDGARSILAERIALDADVRRSLRERMINEGRVFAKATKNAEGKKTKFEAYYDFSEPVAKIPSHRFLAVLRGSKEGVLRMGLALDDDRILADMLAPVLKEPGSPFEPEIRRIMEQAYTQQLRPAIERDVLGLVRHKAEDDAVQVFRANAENLLLAPPAGALTIIGMNPGTKTGCKVAAVDRTGAFLESVTIFPTGTKEQTEEAEKILLALIQKHQVQAVAIGNGATARDIASFVRGILKNVTGQDVFSVLVNDAGIAVYSGSKMAREEFPNMDATARGAISIARRLQDPLAELVKIDPRSIGVGQYQHDVNQKRLREGLYRTVVSCVNHVGVDLNAASIALLRYVSGVQLGTAQAIVGFRDQAKGFRSREQLLSVDGVGPKLFEQCAGFLRVNDGEDVLDGTAIHPEAYPVVAAIAERLGVEVERLLGNTEVLEGLDMTSFISGNIGPAALEDIRSELIKPGRDPRTEFKVPDFLEGVETVSDLEEGMEMEGVVTNVTDFGAFVDVGVHQDGLVHLSELANRFVEDPRKIVKVGEVVKVKVIKVDRETPRISLSMKALEPAPPRKSTRRPRRHKHVPPTEQAQPASGQERSVRDEAGPRRQRDERRRPPSPRSERDGGRGPRGRRGRRGGPKQGTRNAPRNHQSGATEGPLNTALAEQLAALKDKFDS